MKPAGSEVGMTLDWGCPDHSACKPLTGGEVLRTKTGRRYLVVSARKVRSSKHPNRFKVRALVLDQEEEVEGPVYDMAWYPRERKRDRV